MEPSAVQAIKMAIVGASGLSKDALHIYVGLAVALAACTVLRRPLGSWTPVLAALAVAMAGELLDMRDDIASLGYWRWSASLHDMANTVFWPAVLAALARGSSVLGRRP
jgi:hypothetical protein